MIKILLLLISFNAFSAVKLTITNSTTGRNYEAVFNTVLEANAWKAEQISDNSWGLPGQYTICGQTPALLNVSTHCEDVTAQISAQESVIQLRKDINFGQSLYEKITIMINAKPGMNKATRRATRSSFSDITLDLKAGQLCDAKEDISAIVPGSVVTQADKDLIISLISNYKTCP